jgi:hypothetical protein
MKKEERTLESLWAAIQESNRLLTEKQLETERLLKNLSLRDTARHVEIDKILTRITESIQNLNSDVGGMGNSNGDFAEEYFYNSFVNGKQTFFGETFENIEKNLKGIEVGNKAEYDIVLFSGNTLGIVEVKYKACIEHIPKVIKKAETFRVNYPRYANHQIYLAIAAMSFEDEVEDKCHNEGIAIIKQVGDAAVFNYNNLKIF